MKCVVLGAQLSKNTYDGESERDTIVIESFQDTSTYVRQEMCIVNKCKVTPLLAFVKVGGGSSMRGGAATSLFAC